MAATRVRTRRQKVFRSVFPNDVSQPTPSLSATEPGEAFGGPHASRINNHDTFGTSSAAKLAHTSNTATAASIGGGPSSNVFLHSASDQVRWDRAWHVVTSRISLPSSVAVEDSFGTLAPESQDTDVAFYESLSLILDPCSTLPSVTHTEDIVLWHTKQVRQHFVHQVLPLLAACAVQGQQTEVLLGSIQTLEAAHRQYLSGLSLILRGFHDPALADVAISKFRRDLHAIIGNSWTLGLTKALRAVLRRLLAIILGTNVRDPNHASSVPPEEGPVSAARDELLGLLASLHQVGLAGDKFHVLFAEIMDRCMIDFIRNTYSGVWSTSPFQSNDEAAIAAPGCIDHLCDWIENQYGRLAVEVFSRLDGQVAWVEVEGWREIAIGRLATLRIQELFDIVLYWPGSKGGLEDLRSAVTTPQRRLQLTDSFSATLQKRLLHSGRSTLDILQTYISMIRTFHALDHSKVLLDRVVHALQLYLCQRDDAIRIVVTGLLSDPAGSDGDDGKPRLNELAVILNEASQQQRSQADDDDLDWNDMSWVPDPVDAGVNYKRPKNEDVIGTLISALGSQDIFIKEFQLIISERLLSTQTTFQQEIKVLGLLKKRFGEAALQNCDVMIKDIYDSKRVDVSILKAMKGGDNTSHPDSLLYHSKILSRLFWPSLPKDPFTVPAPVAHMQHQYEAGFEQLKTSRKLTWLDYLGSATVHIELEDRTIETECKTYEAAVIYAFQDADPADSGPHLTFNELWETLMMDEDLLEAALRFWISKKVLRNTGNQTYTVMERLDAGSGPSDGAGESTSSPKDGSEGVQPSPRKTKNMDAKEKERRGIYWQFIVGMLTNSSPAMPLGQILMMMKMLIADGCPWSNEELQEFLSEKISEGELELSGGKYRLPKK